MLLHSGILKRNHAILRKTPLRNPSAIRQSKRNRRLESSAIYARLPSANYLELHNCSTFLPILGSCIIPFPRRGVSIPRQKHDHAEKRLTVCQRGPTLLNLFCIGYLAQRRREF